MKRHWGDNLIEIVMVIGLFCILKDILLGALYLTNLVIK